MVERSEPFPYHQFSSNTLLQIRFCLFVLQIQEKIEQKTRTNNNSSVDENCCCTSRIDRIERITVMAISALLCSNFRLQLFS